MENKFKNVRWNRHPCGTGSIFKNTETIRMYLPTVIKKYNICSISDAGAGDLSWIHSVQWPCDVVYTAYDIYPRHENVIKFDIVSEVLPTADLILCRYVLNHLPPGVFPEAIKRFEESGSKYILLTFDFNPKETPWFETHWGEPLESYVREIRRKEKRNWHYGIWEL